ncbi:O-acetyl-ADP-ribose deacetylase (regulator of RNase III), contains Macro domain [Thermostaphylospora chromogena]|uniref:O-acetyl-ADP-ribose deacetylase (Regulator of RNase III), contains Macro domain n=1 Tax=Thermostaphylospora chromogena TaxID=35622 RepID=A0A1H1A578_9ACTN|nr:O-acetyl-ADP-ribose deacetylase (regulator of RNase III), contains Macro domain [Thermostaphylospora chromogena]
MRITLVQGDITEQDVDAVVNAANSSLLGGGGVDGAIHRRGGPTILADCRRLRATRFPKGLPTGQAVATTAGELPALWVIHTVGPVYSPSEDRSELLASCHRESLRVADELGARTVAFPAVSTGAYGWPVKDAARIAVRAVRKTDTRVAEVRFVLFDERAFTAYGEALRAAGPTDEEIAAALAAQPDEAWRRLFDLADALTPDDLKVTWEGGEETEPGVRTVPWPGYSRAVRRILDALSELGVVVVFDWTEWHRRSPLFPDGRGLRDAPVADAARLATTYIRGERFRDGSIQQAIENGALQAILDRLRRWYHEERPASGPGGGAGERR